MINPVRGEERRARWQGEMFFNISEHKKSKTKGCHYKEVYMFGLRTDFVNLSTVTWKTNIFFIGGNRVPYR